MCLILKITSFYKDIVLKNPNEIILFLIFAEIMMIETMEDVEYGVRVGGELLKDFKFANDQGMVSQTE